MEKKDYSMKKAVGLTAVAKYTTVILQFVFTAILSRILTPDQYGTVAVVMIFIAFFQMFSDIGFGAAVIQNKTLTKDEINGIFSFTVLMGLVLSFAFCGFSLLIANFYDDDIYIPLGLLLSVSVLFHTLNTVPNAILFRNKQFGTITVRTILVYTITSLITVFLAIKGWGVYALVLQTILSSIAIFSWNEINAKLKIGFKCMIPAIRKVFSYSIYQFGAMTLNYFNRNLDNILIGKLFNREQLGYYNKSYHLMGMPIQYIPGVINPALQPLLSDHQDNPQYIYDKYIKIIGILSFLGCFVSAFCVANSREIIILLFGNQWEEAVMPFKILSISLEFQLITNTAGAIFQSIGDTKRLFMITLFTSFIICGCIIGGALMGDISHVALMVSIAYIITFFLAFYVLINRSLKFNFIIFLKTLSGDLMVYVIMIFISWLLPSLVDSLLLNLIIKTIIISIVFCSLTAATGSLRNFIDMIAPKILKKSRKGIDKYKKYENTINSSF